MALEFSHNCPHCKTANIGYTGRYNWPIPGNGSQKFVLATCNGCHGGVIFLFHLHKHTSDFDLVNKVNGNLVFNGLRALDSWPQTSHDDMPENIPEQLSGLLSQAIRCLRQAAWDAAGMTFRKVIDVSTKLLDPSLSKKALAFRIDDLENSGKLTSDIKDWAHEIRLDGNDAAHEDDPFTREQAEALHSFVDAYLRYIYTLPKMVERSRHRRNADQG
jgi:hypothetical protein